MQQTPEPTHDPRENTAQAASAVGKHETAKTLILAVSIAILIRSLLFEPFHIPSGSMKNTLLIGDFIFVSKSSYGYSRYSFPLGLAPISGRIFKGEGPHRGDIVVFRLPSAPSIDYIKRLIGLPGDKVQVKGGEIYLNGTVLKRERVADVIVTDETGTRISHTPRYKETLPNGVSYYVLDSMEHGEVDDTKEYVVPEGHFFFMGDNRDQSIDSRYLDKVGYVPEINLVGRAVRVVMSVKPDQSVLAVWNWANTFRSGRFWVDLTTQEPPADDLRAIKPASEL